MYLLFLLIQISQHNFVITSLTHTQTLNIPLNINLFNSLFIKILRIHNNESIFPIFLFISQI